MTRSDYWFLCLLIIISPRISDDVYYTVTMLTAAVLCGWHTGKECAEEYRKGVK